MAKYYKLDNRSVTYKEYWNIVRSPLVIFLWLAKFLRIPLSIGGGIPMIESLADFRVPEEGIAPVILGGIKPKLAELEQFGFHSPVFYRYESGPTLTTFAILMAPCGMTVARIMSSYSAGKKKELVVLISEFEDGTFFVTSDGRKTFEPPPIVTVQRKEKAKIPQLWQAHQQALADWRSRKAVRVFHTVEEAEQSGSRYEKGCMEHGISVGVYVPMDDEENSRLVAKAQAVQVAKEGGIPNAEILAELNQDQEKKTGWGKILMILAVSMVLFLGIGAAQWSWKTTLILIPVLLFHELGHYLAMRIFKYRNLRMFFIPFFGAAVSGRHYNVPGWKKVVVSLMGPMPGIFVGGTLGIAGVILHLPWMVQGALMALIVNGFNLVPVLPLDGGWICHSLVFSRHYLLDSSFRVIAVIALIFGGAKLDSRIFFFLGIFMAMGIPVSYRVARIAFDLRKRELPHASEDDQTIPLETAQAIITEVKNAFPKNVTTKMIAQHTLNIFETLNARPPGWLATIGLLFVYALNFVMALFVGGMLIFAQSRGLGSSSSNSAFRPTHRLEPGSVVNWRGARSGETVDKGQNIVVATFQLPSDARTAFSSLTNAAPMETSMQLFGSTALVTIPADDEALQTHYLNLLRAQTKTVFVATTNSMVTFSLACVAPNKRVAQEIYEDANLYFQALPGMNLNPPWSLKDSSEDQKAKKYSVQLGRVSRSGLIIRFDAILFENLFEGPPALASWLSSKGCKTFRYGIFSTLSENSAE